MIYCFERTGFVFLITFYEKIGLKDTSWVWFAGVWDNAFFCLKFWICYLEYKVDFELYSYKCRVDFNYFSDQVIQISKTVVLNFKES